MNHNELLAQMQDRHRVETFLFQEAELLDDFKLLEWLALLTEDIDYRIPIRTTRAQDDLARSFSADAYHMVEHFGSLEARMKRFGSGGWSEFPPSRARRHVGNIRIERTSSDRLAVKSSLLYFWARDLDQFIVSAERHDEMVDRENALKLARRTVLLDHTSLPLPNLSIML